MTGQDWNFALNSGNRAESHIRLKGEQDWDTAGDVFEFILEYFIMVSYLLRDVRYLDHPKLFDFRSFIKKILF